MGNDVVDLWRWNDWTRRQLAPLIESVKPEDLVREHAGGSKSVHRTMEHLLGAQEAWRNRLAGGDPTFRPPELGVDGGAINRAWLASDAAMLELVQGLAGSDWSRRYRWVRRTDQREFEVTFEVVLRHVATHTVHHRSEVTAMLRAFGYEIPSCDYIRYATGV
jgi:uncharacterized damage-inducible protein DinB